MFFSIFCLCFLTCTSSQEKDEKVLESPIETTSSQEDEEKVLESPVKATSSQEDEEDEVLEIPVKRLLSRHRRFIAPGTRWDWLVGWETLSDNFDIKFYLLVICFCFNKKSGSSEIFFVRFFLFSIVLKTEWCSTTWSLDNCKIKYL